MILKNDIESIDILFEDTYGYPTARNAWQRIRKELLDRGVSKSDDNSCFKCGGQIAITCICCGQDQEFE